MSKILCKLFGAPQIMKDGQPVFLPYTKINALLYYILVTKVVSREEIAGLLWPDEDAAVAKKNIRNAIYQAKKCLGEDIIISPQKTFLMLNEALDIETDVDRFLQSPWENLGLYTGDFLQGFFLKEAEAYEEWVAKMRGSLEEKFSSQCYLKIEDDIQRGSYDEVETLVHRLIALDEFDERNFRLLMRFYQDTGRSGKVIETYYDLSKLLRRELGIDPDKKTKAIYQRALEEINFSGGKNHPPESAFFYGRYNELAEAEKALQAFRQKKEGKCLLIRGAWGVGKSTLKDKLMKENAGDLFMLETRSYQTEQNMPLRPWYAIARGIAALLQKEKLFPPALWRELMSNVFPDFSENLPGAKYATTPLNPLIANLTQLITQALASLSTKKQVLLVFDDLQWIDEDSLRLLTSVLLESKPDQVMLAATCDQQCVRVVEDALTDFERHRGLAVISLEPFHIEACHHFIEEAMPGEKLQGDTLERIYNETEGNPFLLREYIDILKRGEDLGCMTAAMECALKARFLYLSPESLELATMVSFFNDRVTLDFLQQLMEKSEKELLAPLETLKARDILSEEASGSEIMLGFTHGKLREYIYKTQATSRQKYLHQEIGRLLEERLKGQKTDAKLNAKLIYHFTQAGNLLKALKYQIDILNQHLNFSHEMFPILGNTDGESNNYMSRHQITELFHKLEEGFKEISVDETQTHELDILRIEFFYMKGRYLIREGAYEDGVNRIAYVIEKAQQIGDQDYTLESYKQMILYYLQINDLTKMAEYTELALDLAVKCNYHKEIGIILRLKGLYHMMTGSYILAEKLFTESINTLAVTETVAKRYAANIAAAYNYIGEIRQAEEEYESALSLFNKAVSLCLGRNVLSSLSYFYINAGKTAYFMDDIPSAHEYFEKAYALYGEFDSFWRRPVLDSYMALTLVREGQYKEALHYLVTARTNVGHIKDPCEVGTVFFASALIQKQAEQGRESAQILQQGLPHSAKHYVKLAMRNLNQYCNRYEIKTLHQMFGPI